jgi:hypothetical protein
VYSGNLAYTLFRALSQHSLERDNPKYLCYLS